MNAALKQLSPLTRPIGPGKLMRNFAINEIADQMLPIVAAQCGFPNVSEYLRAASVFMAEAKLGAKALPFKSAMRVTIWFFIVTIPFVSVEARRPRQASRTVAHVARKREVMAS